MSSYSQTKRSKPIIGGESEEEYRRVMQKILDGLTKDNMETIMFLCKDHIPHGREINSSLEFFKYLEDRDLVSQDDAVFIAEVLHLIRRMDLLKIIPCIKNKRHFEDEFLSLSYTHFSNYRVLTVHLQDELSQSDFEKFRHHCSSHLKNRSLDNASSVLTLLKKLEEEDVISQDNFEELLKILKNVENVKPLKMFQRLLDGDDSVVMPASKQVPKYEAQAAYAERNPGFVPPTQDFRNSRVEMMPPGQDSGRSGFHAGLDHSQTNSKVKGSSEKNDPITYTFDHGGASFSQRVFNSGESTPKTVVSGTPIRPEYAPWGNGGMPYHSMPPQRMNMNSPHLQHQNSSSGSLPYHYHGSPPPVYEDGYHPHNNYQHASIVHGATYPMNLNQLPQYEAYQRQDFSHAQYQPQTPPQMGHGSVFEGFIQHQDHPQYHPYYEPRHHYRHASQPNTSLTPTVPKENSVHRIANLHVENSNTSTQDSDDRCILEEGDYCQQLDKATCNDDTTEKTAISTKSQRLQAHDKDMEKLMRRNQELEELLKNQRDAESYKMDSSPVGVCVLINNVAFEKNFNHPEYERRLEVNKGRSHDDQYELPKTELMDRVGSNVDADKLEKLFTSFDFKVERYNDSDQREMKRIFKEVASADHSAYDCFMLIILSHGDLGCVYGVDSYPIEIVEIQECFYANRCETLKNKPKIFIFQACQGTKSMPSVAPEADVDPDGPKRAAADHSIPNKADFLMAYSTVPGYLSYRDRVGGSHFIMEVIRTFKKFYKTQDLLSMMIMVNNEMSKYLHKQVPMPVPTLRKKVFFRLKEGWVDEEEDADELEDLCTSIQVSHLPSSPASSEHPSTSCAEPSEAALARQPSNHSVFTEQFAISKQESREQD